MLLEEGETLLRGSKVYSGKCAPGCFHLGRIGISGSQQHRSVESETVVAGVSDRVGAGIVVIRTGVSQPLEKNTEIEDVEFSVSPEGERPVGQDEVTGWFERIMHLRWIGEVLLLAAFLGQGPHLREFENRQTVDLHQILEG